MTPEQFVYWIAGYLSGGRDNDAEVTVEEITQVLKEVKVSAHALYMITPGG